MLDGRSRPTVRNGRRDAGRRLLAWLRLAPSVSMSKESKETLLSFGARQRTVWTNVKRASNRTSRLLVAHNQQQFVLWPISGSKTCSIYDRMIDGCDIQDLWSSHYFTSKMHILRTRGCTGWRVSTAFLLLCLLLFFRFLCVFLRFWHSMAWGLSFFLLFLPCFR